MKNEIKLVSNLNHRLPWFDSLSRAGKMRRDLALGRPNCWLARRVGIVRFLSLSTETLPHKNTIQLPWFSSFFAVEFSWLQPCDSLALIGDNPPPPTAPYPRLSQVHLRRNGETYSGYQASTASTRKNTLVRGYLVQRGRPGKKFSEKNNNKVFLRVSFENMSELRSIILGIGHGLKDSLFGMTALFKLSSILGENQTENQFKSSFRRTSRQRANNSMNAPDKKTDR